MPLFSKKVDVKEEVRNAQRSNRKGVRDVQSEIRQLDAQEKRLIGEIKRAAKTNEASAKILAKQLVQLRAQKTNLQKSAASLQGINHNLSVQKTTHMMAGTMASTAATMGKVNAAMQPAKMAADMRNFAQANARMDMAQSAMDDALDDIFETDDAEADELIDQVMAEVGIDAVTGAVAAPRGRVGAAAPAQSEEDAEVAQILAGLQ